jgi:glutamate/tyrosine decarboxylase-like PLP-dependent enzyme
MKKRDAAHLQDAMFEEVQAGEILERALKHAREYSTSVRERRVYPDDAALQALERFDEPLPETPGDAIELLDLLHTVGSPGTVAQTGGRFFGLVDGGIVPAALGARLLADTWDQNAVLHATSPINSKLEEVAERWLRSLLGLPETTVAGYVSGTSLATACGLAAARYRLLLNANWEVNRKGLQGAPALRIVTGRHAHGTVVKMLAILGFGTESIEWVDVDEQGRVIADAVPDLDDRTIVVLQAGNVDSGSFDPIRAICEKANSAGAWVHVDGAFGLWAAACDRLRQLVDGIELANSCSVDAHKTLNAPYDCGVILCRDREALVGALQNSGAYIVFTENRDGMLYTPDMSRRARAVDLWATLRYLGRTGIDQLVWGLHERARQFAEELQAEEFDVLNDVVFNQVIVACDDDAVTDATIPRIQASGEAWVGGSSWFGRSVIRVSVCSWATTAEDVTRSVRAFVEAREAARGTLAG